MSQKNSFGRDFGVGGMGLRYFVKKKLLNIPQKLQEKHVLEFLVN